MKYVKKLPSSAIFDYRDVFGYDRYHTQNRIYHVKKYYEFGIKKLIIISLRKNEV